MERQRPSSGWLHYDFSHAVLRDCIGRKTCAGWVTEPHGSGRLFAKSIDGATLKVFLCDTECTIRYNQIELDATFCPDQIKECFRALVGHRPKALLLYGIFRAETIRGEVLREFKPLSEKSNA